MKSSHLKQMVTPVLALALLIGVERIAAANPEEKGQFAQKKIEKLKEKLALTDEQSAKIESILNAAGEKHKAIQEDAKKQIDAVLTEEQKKKYAELKEEMKEKLRGQMKERMGEKHGKGKKQRLYE